MITFGCLCLLFIIGIYLRNRFLIFKKFFIPSSIISGILGLLIMSIDKLNFQMIPPSIVNSCKALPVLLINIVFRALFIGKKLPPLKNIWANCSRQLAYGQIVAWGQYFIGCCILLFLLNPFYDIPVVFAGIMPVGFEGGHGTAAGMADVFKSLGYPELIDLTLASATVGILFSISIGMILINWAIRKGYIENLDDNKIVDIDYNHKNDESNSEYNLAVHLCIIGIAILIGVILKEILSLISLFFSEEVAVLVKSFPVFPLCMIGGFVVQKISEKRNLSHLINSLKIQNIQNIALDFLIIAAISSISLDIVNSNLFAFSLLVTGGIVWNIFCVIYVAKYVFKNDWFQRAIAEMGQSMGVTATGLLLLRVVDPNCKTKAASAFASKQLLHEPFMGGGLWTGMAIPMLVIYGGWHVLIITSIAIAIWSLYLFFSSRN